MIIIDEENQDSQLIDHIIDQSPQLNWGTIMGRYICGCGWSAIQDWPDGSGYSDHTPYLVFYNHVKEHGIETKPHRR